MSVHSASLPLGPGILSAQLMSQPELVQALAPGNPQNPDFQRSFDLFNRLAQGLAPAEGTTTASLQRAEQSLKRLRSRVDRSLQDPELGPFRDLLANVIREQPDLASGRLEDWGRGAAYAFADTYVTTLEKGVSHYSGLQAMHRLPGLTSIGAVDRTLKAMFGAVGEKLSMELQREGLELALMNEQPGLLSKYAELNNAQLCSLATELPKEYVATLPGSAERIEVYWQMRAHAYELLGRDDLSHKFYESLLAAQNYAGLSRSERDYLIELKTRLAETRSYRRAALQLELVNGLRFFYQRAAAFPVADSRRGPYLDVTQELAVEALRLGLPLRALRAIAAEHSTPAQDHAVSLASIYEQAIELRPQDLPVEIKKALEQTGQWERVSQAVERVVLEPQLESTEKVKQIIGGVPHGRTYFLDRTVVIATQVEDVLQGTEGSVSIQLRFPPWRIAGLIAHEAAHVHMMREIEEMADRGEAERLLSNVAQEREANAWEAQFYRDYLASNAGQLDPAQRADLLECIWNCELIVHACNLLLGIPLSLLEPGLKPSRDPAAFAKFGVAPDEIDLNAYPTRLAALLGRIDGLIELRGRSRLELAALRRRLEKRLEELIVRPMQEKFSFLQQRTEHALRPLKGLLGPQISDANFRTALPLLLHQVQEIQRLEGGAPKVQRIQQILGRMVEQLGVDLPPDQIALFLAIFPDLVQAQESQFREQLGLKQATGTQAPPKSSR